MTNNKPLYKKLGDKAYKKSLTKPSIPKYIQRNLKYRLFKWQKKALKNLLTYQAIRKKTRKTHLPTHLMFNMATGSGKTLLMAALILYYYKEQGMRHFLFFVNRNNIVEKTEHNFLDSTHTKYLFNENITIDNSPVPINKVDLFSTEPQGIEIKFTSIQKLYNDIHIERENQTTLDDLHRKNIVMFADEAHHLNSDTSKIIQDELIKSEITGSTSQAVVERKGWEHTVLELILRKNNQSVDNKNVLLEFTATVPNNVQVQEKYRDKIIYKFDLKQFLKKGYTKEINLISSTLTKKERVLQALLFQWYRHHIALKHDIANFKPVILFRSKTIADSQQDFEQFLEWMNAISGADFDFLDEISKKICADGKTANEMGKSRTERVLSLIKPNGISKVEIAHWITQNYNEKTTRITNSKTNKTQKEKTDEDTEKLLNNLEDKSNPIRAIFTVERLTEGWDVLNLFDIVRLYQGQNSGGSTRKTPEATTKEKQLIGRGVRYFPFECKGHNTQKRKFDGDVNHDLRVLEELYYYTYDEESRYISHLKDELRKDGYINDDKIIQNFALKPEFKESDFYKKTKIWYNKRIDNPHIKRQTLDGIQNNTDFSLEYKIRGLELTEQEMKLGEKQDLQKLHLEAKIAKIFVIKASEIEKHVFRKALNKKALDNPQYQFENLKDVLEIKTVDALQQKILANFEITITASETSYDDIPQSEKLAIATKVLEHVLAKMKESITPKIGSDFIAGDFEQFFAEPKTKSVAKDKIDNSIAEDCAWYVLDSFSGTSEEKGLVAFIKSTIGNLEEKYDEIHLLRNEEMYKIYSFKDGRGFQPDFLLFLKGRDHLSYQIFIEPKGDQYKDKDGNFKLGKEGWKENLLTEISERYGLQHVIKAENIDYRLIGLPFYNEKKHHDFKSKFKKVLLDANSGTSSDQ